MNRNRFDFLVFIIITSLLFFNPVYSLSKSKYYQNDSFNSSINTTMASWEWESTTIISDEGHKTSDDSDIAIDPYGNVHVVWTDKARSEPVIDIFYKQRNNATGSWSEIEVVSKESDDSAFNPSIAVDNSGNVHVVWYDFTDLDADGHYDTDIFYKWRNSVTGSWTTTEVISENSESSSSDPDIAVDNVGNVHIVWDDSTDNYQGSGNDYDIFHRRWDNVAGSWASIELVSMDSTDGSHSSAITVDSSGNAYIVWDDFTDDYQSSGDDRDVFYRIWNNSLSSWNDVELISFDSTENSKLPDITTDKDDSIHICWEDLTDYNSAGNSDYDIFYRQWDKEFNSWIVTQVVSTESTGNSNSSHSKIATDTAGNVHIVWDDEVDYLSCGTDIDVFYKKWNKSSTKWSPAEVISSESVNKSKEATIGIDNADGIHICWDDFENSTPGGAVPVTDIDVYYKRCIGPPSTPILSSIIPNPSYTGNITLFWNDTYGAVSYSIYRDNNSTISSIDEKTPIATIKDTTFLDTLNSTGIYYYAVVANNYNDTSSLSNCESVTVTSPPKSNFPSFLIDGYDILPLLIGGGGFILGCLVIIIIQKIRK